VAQEVVLLQEVMDLFLLAVVVLVVPLVAMVLEVNVAFTFGNHCTIINIQK
jgi:hypothetical protein